MRYFLDAAYAPSTAAARRQFSLGWTAYGGYIGGPRATNAWSHSDFERLAAIGFTFVPLYVGRTSPYDSPSAFTHEQGIIDGTEACVQTGACGFNETTILCLDAEYGDWQNEPKQFEDYLRAWVSVVNGAGHPAVLYSDPRTIDILGVPELVDRTWGADYVTNGRRYNAAPVGQFDPSIPPAWHAWQWADNGLIGGAACDLNSATDDFPFAEFTPA